jgi:hypothetical protein
MKGDSIDLCFLGLIVSASTRVFPLSRKQIFSQKSAPNLHLFHMLLTSFCLFCSELTEKSTFIHFQENVRHYRLFSRKGEHENFLSTVASTNAVHKCNKKRMYK